MKPPDTIIIDGRAYSWRVLIAARREQLEAWKAAQPQQPALFALKQDCRPAAERTAAGRYHEPSLLGSLQEQQGWSGERKIRRARFSSGRGCLGCEFFALGAGSARASQTWRRRSAGAH